MRAMSVLFAGSIVMMSFVLIGPGQASASAQVYDFTTIAGLAAQPGYVEGTNNASRFSAPTGVLVDTNGDLYVTDRGNSVIRKMTRVGTNWVTTIIAGGTQGSADGTNGNASFSGPFRVAQDRSGNLYVADSNNETIRKVTPVGTNWVVSTIAGFTLNTGSADGTNSDAQFSSPYGIAVDANGSLYVADTGNHTLRKITPVGANWVTTTIVGLAAHPGAADGTNNAARLSYPYDVAVDTNGDLYVADLGSKTIRKITPMGANWVTITLAGSGSVGSADGTNRAAEFSTPSGIAVDARGNVYVTDDGNDTIRKVAPVGTNWVTTTIGGLAQNQGGADGTNSAARFSFPDGIAVDARGVLYVADTYNDTIRQGIPWGMLTILKETAKLSFVKTNACSCTLTATLDLDAGYDLTNTTVSLDIGGADVSFTLDAKGKGRGMGAYGTCKLSYKKKTGPGRSRPRSRTALGKRSGNRTV